MTTLRPVLPVLFASVALWLGSCNPTTEQAPGKVNPEAPSPAVAKVIQQFLDGDSLAKEPKIYVAYIQQDSVIGKADLFLTDIRMAEDVRITPPLLAWHFGKQTVLVYTGLETMLPSRRLPESALVDSVRRINYYNIDDRPFRNWKISITDNQVTAVDKHNYDWHIKSKGIPPPPPILIKLPAAGKQPS
jgi:hypothetical protein